MRWHEEIRCKSCGTLYIVIRGREIETCKYCRAVKAAKRKMMEVDSNVQK